MGDTVTFAKLPPPDRPEVDQAARVERYVEGYFQRAEKTAFPTVRQVARALRLKQAEVEQAAADSDNLMLTSFNTEVPEKLGGHHVETLEAPEEVTTHG